MRDKHGLLSQPIGHVLLKMSLPNVIGILTILLASLVDTFFVSKLGTDALTSISFTFPVTLIVSSIAIGIGTGVSTNFGRLIGSGNAPNAKFFLHDALLTTLALMTLLGIIGLVTINPLFKLLGATSVSLPLIYDYMVFWYLGSPLLVLMMVSNQALRATGDTRSAAKIMIIAASVNIILDPLLIFGLGPFPKLGMQGAAIATSLSWVCALSFSWYLLAVKKKMLSFVGINFCRIKSNWKRLAHISQPAALMNLINPVFNAILMAVLARINHDAVAAFGAGTKVESLLLLVTVALSSSLVPFIAQNLGANQKERAHRALMLAIKFVLIFQTLIYIPIYFLANPIALIFSTDPDIVKWLTFYIQVLPIAYGPLSVVILVATSLNAYHRPIASLVLNICRLFLLMLPLAIVGAKLWGVEGLMLALPITNIIMGMACYILAKQISESPKAVSHSNIDDHPALKNADNECS